MLYAISAWFDEASEQSIRNMWKEFHTHHINSTFYLGPYRPHITLALFDTDRIEDVVKDIRHILASMDGFSVHISSIGVFNESSTLFLNCAISQELYDLHSRIYAILSSLSIKLPTYYLPGQWTPHISLAVNVSKHKLAEGLERVQEWTLPLNILVNRVGVIKEFEKQELEVIYLGQS